MADAVAATVAAAVAVAVAVAAAVAVMVAVVVALAIGRDAARSRVDRLPVLTCSAGAPALYRLLTAAS